MLCTSRKGISLSCKGMRLIWHSPPLAFSCPLKGHLLSQHAWFFSTTPPYPLESDGSNWLWIQTHLVFSSIFSKLSACFDRSSYASLVRNYCYLRTQRAVWLLRENTFNKLQAFLASIVRGWSLTYPDRLPLGPSVALHLSPLLLIFAPGGSRPFCSWIQTNPTPSVQFGHII